MPYAENKSLTSSTFENFLSSIYKRLEVKNEIIINLKNYEFIDLGALTYMLAFCCALRTNKIPEHYIDSPINIILPDNKKALNFVIKSNLFSFTSIHDVFFDSLFYEKKEIKFARNFYPYMPFKRVVEKNDRYESDERYELVCNKFISSIQDKFRDVLSEHLGFPKTTVNNFWSPNIEIISNIYYHSNSWGVGTIQSTSKGVTICYADIGRGVKETLEPYRGKIMASNNNLRSWNDGSAILGAFMQGITSQDGKSRGQGLYILKKYVFENKGYIEFRSGRAKVIFSPKRKTKGAFVDYIPGVQINIWLPRFK